MSTKEVVTGEIGSGSTLGSVCKMCAQSRTLQSTHAADTILFESEHFIATPTLGALVEGWLLILPRDHYISTAALPSNLQAEREKFCRTVKESLTELYGPIIEFEHGPANAGSQAGCSVDHAHIHLLPFTEDLREEAERYLPPEVRFEPGDFDSCSKARNFGLDYIYYIDAANRFWFCEHASLGSQIMRRAIASVLGKPERYNWKSHPELENIVATIRRLA